MLPTSHYDEEKADRAVRFIEMLCHTKGEWSGQPFWLLPWEAKIVKDVFGTIKEDGLRVVRVHRNVFVKKPIELLGNPKAVRATAWG